MSFGWIVAPVVGIALAVVAVVGGVTLITPEANSAAASDQVVRYDAP